MDITKLKKLISDKKLKVGIIGFGYVGMPLGVEFAKNGFNVTAFEIDKKKINLIKKGISYITDIETRELKKLVNKGLIKSTNDFSIITNQDVIIICVPTPLNKTKNPDISYIVSVIELISKKIKKEMLIILESTSYPTTTNKIVKPILEKSGLKAGVDFFLAFSPERIDPGNKKFGIKNTPKIIGGINYKSTELAKEVYSSIMNQVITVSNSTTAETVKLLENTFRAVNIAMINEFAMICNKLNIDIWEVIDAAKTKPFGFMPFYPGPGIGGHCIPIDPIYLKWKMEKMGLTTKFIKLADKINSKMPKHIVQKIINIMSSKTKTLKGAKILIIGLSYKPNINDYRNSPALDIISILLTKGSKIYYHDPYIKEIKIGNKKYSSVPLKKLSSYDCIVILTNHSSTNYAKILKESKIIFDTRNALKDFKSDKITKL